MSHIFKPSALLVMIALAGPSWAQDAPPATGENTGEDAPETTDGSQSNPTAGDLSMGQDVPTEENAQPGQPYVVETYGDWEQRCVRTEDGSDPCQLYQLLRDQEDNAVAEISVFPLPAGQQQQAAAGATIITPLETLLTEEITLSVDGNQARRYPFEFCVNQGCFSRVGFTEPEVTQFQRGAEATMTIVPAAAPDQQIDLAISLNGFTDGYDAVTEANAQ